jgi:hypothetical protein
MKSLKSVNSLILFLVILTKSVNSFNNLVHMLIPLKILVLPLFLVGLVFSSDDIDISNEFLLCALMLASYLIYGFLQLLEVELLLLLQSI